MGAITEVRYKVQHINQLVEEVFYAIDTEDYHHLQTLKDLSEKVYNDLSPRSRNAYHRYLSKLLYHWKLDDKEDLNGFFSAIIGTDVAEYQPDIDPDSKS